MFILFEKNRTPTYNLLQHITWTKKQANLELDTSKSLNQLILAQENPKLFAHLGKYIFVTLFSLSVITF